MLNYKSATVWVREAKTMMRILVICTHNSARSQMAEAWLRTYAKELGFNAEIVSAGTEKTFVKPNAIKVMEEAGIDMARHSSKALSELEDKWNFDLVITVCDKANEVCPVYASKTKRLHYSFEDPSGKPLRYWRETRNDISKFAKVLIRRSMKSENISASLIKAEIEKEKKRRKQKRR